RLRLEALLAAGAAGVVEGADDLPVEEEAGGGEVRPRGLAIALPLGDPAEEVAGVGADQRLPALARADALGDPEPAGRVGPPARLLDEAGEAEDRLRPAAAEDRLAAGQLALPAAREALRRVADAGAPDRRGLGLGRRGRRRG